MSDNLHRAIEDRRDTNSDAWTMTIAARGPPSQDLARRAEAALAVPAFAKASAGQPSRFEGWLANRSGLGREGWWSQTESNRRPPACKAGALPTELWPPVQESVISDR
jgi:hypothetical protein